MPGKKDYVSIGRKQHMQKRLILCNLIELYVSFKTKYPQEVIGFSKFCSLRPKWCITVGASGTHSVCVCALHQNAILLTNAIQIKCTYKDLMTKVVCDVTSNECMVHRCPNCPGIVSLKKFLDAQLIDNDEEVSFNQWQKTDRTTLIYQTTTMEEYKLMLSEPINKLTAHSYIAKCQARYLKQQKENLAKDCCIVLGDFAENFTFVIQDEIQSYHWCKSQCTLHPVALYLLNENDQLEKKSFCFM
jgi:hypothetical protein